MIDRESDEGGREREVVLGGGEVMIERRMKVGVKLRWGEVTSHSSCWGMSHGVTWSVAPSIYN